VGERVVTGTFWPAERLVAILYPGADKATGIVERSALLGFVDPCLNVS